MKSRSSGIITKWPYAVLQWLKKAAILKAINRRNLLKLINSEQIWGKWLNRIARWYEKKKIPVDFSLLANSQRGVFKKQNENWTFKDTFKRIQALVMCGNSTTQHNTTTARRQRDHTWVRERLSVGANSSEKAIRLWINLSAGSESNMMCVLCWGIFWKPEPQDANWDKEL